MLYFLIYWAVAVIYLGINFYFQWKKFQKYKKNNMEFQFMTQALFRSANMQLLFGKLWNPWTLAFVIIPLGILLSPFAFPLLLVGDIKKLLGIKSELQKKAEAETKAMEEAKKASEEFMKNEGGGMNLLEHINKMTEMGALGDMLKMGEPPKREEEAQPIEFFHMNLKHLALYMKGHYERGNAIWDDVKKCLIADDYEPNTTGDMLGIVIRNVAPMFSNYGIPEYTRELVEAIQPSICWRYGFYTKEHTWCKPEDIANFPDYDYQTAILYFFLSRLQGATVKECGGLPEADPNVLPLTKKEESINSTNDQPINQ